MADQKKGWLKAGSYSLLGYAAQLGFAFVSFILLVRMLPEYEFGVWVLFLTLTSFAEMGRGGLLQNAIIKFCVEEEAEYANILSSGFWVNTLGSVVLGLVLVALSYPLSVLWSAPELTQLMWWYLPWALLNGSARYLDLPHMVHHDFKGIFWSKGLYGGFFLLGIIGLWWWNGGITLLELAILQIFAAVPALLIYAVYGTRYLRWGKYSADWAKRILHFGKYVLGTNISSMLFNKMDLMMVGFFLHPAAVAIYNVATRVTNYLEVPMSGISQVIYPKIALANSNGSKVEVGALYEKSVGLIVALVLPLVLLVLGLSEWVVVLVAGKAYASAAPLLNILVIAVMIKPWSRLFGITLDAIGKPQLNFALLGLGLVLNIILNALFISWWGLQGAAIATLVAMILLVVTGQILIERILPISQGNIFRHILLVYTKPRQLLDFK
ncbi:oligosaccharide flippase family protein [Lewinella sp. LCG006]|uniref:oligosaccharide flippase family protein n=1 Tax=Lewinella sp. LCG006 TaxID=3231911 RepID=UPI00345F890D